MTLDQCRKWNLEPSVVPESFSLCTLQKDAGLRDSSLSEAIMGCCTTPINRYWCWNYCAVEESQFPVWLDCVAKEGKAWASACQKADHSIVKPPSTSSTKSTTSIKTTTSSTSTTSTTIETTPTSEPTGRVDLRGTATLLPTFGSNGTNATGGLSRPTDFVQVGSSKALVLSTGGMMCAFLVLSTLAL